MKSLDFANKQTGYRTMPSSVTSFIGSDDLWFETEPKMHNFLNPFPATPSFS